MGEADVDNVDNLVDSFRYGKPDSTEKPWKLGENKDFDKIGIPVLCKCLIHGKIHMFIPF